MRKKRLSSECVIGGVAYMKKLRIISLIVLVILCVISIDLLFNFLGNLVPEMNDGLGMHSVLLPGKLFFGDSR